MTLTGRSRNLKRRIDTTGVFQDQIEERRNEVVIIKTAHFRKDGVVLITDDQRVNTLKNVRKKGIHWEKVR